MRFRHTTITSYTANLLYELVAALLSLFFFFFCLFLQVSKPPPLGTSAKRGSARIWYRYRKK